MPAKSKVLLVDDDVGFLEVIAYKIKPWGYDVITASTAKEALEILKKENPGIMVLDYIMEEMSGVEILRRVRKSGNKIPVIMLTAYPDTKSIKDAEALDVSCYIPKASGYSDTEKALKSALEMLDKRRADGR